jgi:hypothetical protein
MEAPAAAAGDDGSGNLARVDSFAQRRQLQAVLFRRFLRRDPHVVAIDKPAAGHRRIELDRRGRHRKHRRDLCRRVTLPQQIADLPTTLGDTFPFRRREVGEGDVDRHAQP